MSLKRAAGILKEAYRMPTPEEEAENRRHVAWYWHLRNTAFAIHHFQSRRR